MNVVQRSMPQIALLDAHTDEDVCGPEDCE